jgi:opacity protein-like surface antigen
VKLLAFLLLILSTFARGAVVVLKDGGQVSGTVVSATARDVTIQTGSGVRTIPAETISRIEYSEGESAYDPGRMAAPAPVRDDVLWHELTANFGVGVPLDRIDFGSLGGGRATNGDAGPRIGFEYLMPIDRRLSAGPGFDWYRRSSNVTLGAVPSAVTEISGDSLLFMAWAKYSTRPGRDIRPYARIGAGAHRTTTAVDAVPQEGFAWADTQTFETRRLVDDEAWGLALAAAFGVDFAYNEAAFVGLELGWLGLQGEAHRPAPAGQALGMQGGRSALDSLTIGMRWGMRF